MKKIATGEQMKKIDNVAIKEYGIPSLVLMENAAASVFNCIKDNCKNGNQVSVFCGPGNNGGDGIAIARLLMNDGCKVRCFLIGNREKMTTDAKVMEVKLNQIGGKLEDFESDEDIFSYVNTSDIIIDAIFGVGLQREVGGDFLSAVKLINSSKNSTVIACDIPTGIDSNKGSILGEAVRADYTVTFSISKHGLEENDGKVYSGKIIIADIGIPDEIINIILNEKNA